MAHEHASDERLAYAGISTNDCVSLETLLKELMLVPSGDEGCHDCLGCDGAVDQW